MADEYTKFPSVQDVPPLMPELGDESQFARQKGLQFGPLKIGKDGFTADDGTGIAVRVDSSGFHGYNSTSGAETIRVSSGGVDGYGTQGNTFEFYNSQGGTNYGQMGYLQSINAFYFASNNSANINFLSDSDLNMGASDDIGIVADDTLTLSGDAGDVNIVAGDDVFVSCDEFFINGSPKTAIVETSKGYRALYCAEAPEVWFFDFCYGRRVRRGWKFWAWEWEVKPDKLFLETIEGPLIVMPTGSKNVVQLWGKRKGMAKRRFEQKTEREFKENNKFWATPRVKAQKLRSK